MPCKADSAYFLCMDKCVVFLLFLCYHLYIKVLSFQSVIFFRSSVYRMLVYLCHFLNEGSKCNSVNSYLDRVGPIYCVDI